MPEMERPGDGAARWVDVVAEASRLLVDRDLGEDRVASVLELIGTAAGADGAVIYEGFEEPGTGRRRAALRYGWTRGQSATRLDDPVIRGHESELCFEGWWDRLAAGESISGLCTDFPPVTRDILRAHGMVSILVAPIRIGGDLWGSASLTSESAERRWDGGETLLLTAVAGTLGASVVRGRAEREIQALQKRIEYLLEATGTSMDIIDSDHNIRFVDASWSKVYGDFRGRKCHEYFFGDSVPHEGCGVTRAIAENRVVRTERNLPREGGRTIEVVSIPFQDEDGGWRAAEINIDVTEKKATRQAVEDHRAFHAVLATVRGVAFSESEEALTRTFLEAVVREYGFKMSWCGRLRDGAVHPVLWAGAADGYLEGLRLEIRDAEHPDARCAMSQAILTGLPFGYADLHNDEGFRRWRDYALELGYRSNLAIPLDVEGRTEGGVMVYSEAPGAFAPERTERLAVLVRELGSLLGDRRRSRRAEEQIRIQRDLAFSLAAASTFKEALEQCLDAALTASGLECGGAYLVNPASGAMDLACWRNLSDDFVRKVKSYGAASGEVSHIHTGRTLYAPVAAFPSASARVMSDEGLTALATLPVLYKGRPVACLNLASRALVTIPDQVRGILEAIAFQIGGALARIQAEEQILVQRDLAIGLAAASSVAEAMELCLDVALKSSGMDCGGAYLVNPEGGGIDLICWRNLPAAAILKAKHFPADSSHAALVRAGSPIYSPVDTFPSGSAEEMAQEGLKSVAILPVLYGDRAVACLNVSSKIHRDIPTQSRGALEAVAIQIGGAIARIRAQESLRSSEHLYRSTVDSLEAWLHVVDEECRIILINEAFQKLNRDLGLRGEPIGTTPWEFYKVLPAEVEEQYHQVFQTGKPLVTQEVVTFGSRKNTTRTTKIPIFDAGRVVRVLTIVHDITPQIRAKEERERMEASIQQAQKFESLGVLAGGVAHDFNNLLTGILGHCELALLEIPEGGRARGRVQKVRAAAQRAADLTRQLLDCAGKGGREVQPVDLNALVREMADLLEASIPKRNRVSYNLTPGLPPVEGDPTQFRQVVMNLILNASEALGQDGGVVTVRTGWGWMNGEELAGSVLPGDLEDGNYAVFEVSDSGCGMDEETVRRIFDPFFTTKFAGRGLGLAAVLGIIRGHGGTLQVKSRPGEGATFRVLLPTSTALQDGWSEEMSAGAPRRDGALAVVGEWETSIRDMVRESLEARGFQVETAADGRALLDLWEARGAEPEVLVVDLDIPGPEGRDVIARIADMSPGLPVLITSGFPEGQALRGITLPVAVRFLQKPFGARELLRTLSDLLGQGKP